jgi:hypothetical protein
VKGDLERLIEAARVNRAATVNCRNLNENWDRMSRQGRDPGREAEEALEIACELQRETEADLDAILRALAKREEG